MPPEFVVVGSVVKDIAPGGWRLGGTAAYASLQAFRLGLRAAAVTSCAPDVSPAEHVPGVQWHVLASETTTSFDNRYRQGRREQWVRELAAPLGPGHIPPAWCTAPLVLIGPVFHDVDPEVARLFPETSHVGLAVQGWLRLEHGGRVGPGSVHPKETWLVGDTVFVSDEDVDDPEAVAVWLNYIATIILTRGARGCTIWDDGGRHEVAAFAVTEVDPTGAGDVFAAAYLIRLRETGHKLTAARFASAAAALAVQGSGLQAVAGREQIDSLLASGQPASVA